MNIKIVNLDGSLPTPKSLLIRYGTYFGFSIVPAPTGSILSLINVLFIFGKEKRCGHEQIAKTKVIKTINLKA